MLKTVKHISVPCFLMCVTTSIGFLSLIASDVTPVKTTGIFMAAGIMMSFFVCITLVPGMLSLFPECTSRPFMNIQKDRSSSNKEFQGIYGFIGKVVKDNTIYIFVVFPT